jgi:hypothetical protein
MRKQGLTHKQSIPHEIKKSLKTLNADKPFTNFNILLSQEEIKNLKTLHIKISKVYDNFGKLDHLKNELDEFLKSLNKDSNEISRSISTLIKKIVSDVVLGFEKETAWVAVRASIATDPANT